MSAEFQDDAFLSRSEVERFAVERKFQGFLETSAKMTFKKEFEVFLKKHGMDYSGH